MNDDRHVRHQRGRGKSRVNQARVEATRKDRRIPETAKGNDDEAGSLDRMSERGMGTANPKTTKTRRHTHLRQAEDDINFTGDIRVVVAENVLRGLKGFSVSDE